VDVDAAGLREGEEDGRVEEDEARGDDAGFVDGAE
jgi:hypothetical protein